jgi:hypothetical protein
MPRQQDETNCRLSHEPRTIAECLNIDIGEPTLFNLQRMEWAINDWLHDHNMLHMKAAPLQWPEDKEGDGSMFFLTKSRTDHEAPGTLMEEASDVEVKKWLGRHGAKKVEWLSLRGRFDITLGGDQPKHTSIKYKQYTTIEEFMAKFCPSYRV